MAKSGCVRSEYSYICMYKVCCKCQLDGDLEASLYGSPPEPLQWKRKRKVKSMRACEVSLKQVSRCMQREGVETECCT